MIRLLSLHFTRHLQVFFSSLGRMVRHPGSTIMTTCMLGITLALPGGLYVFLQNLNKASVNWSDQARVSIYLQPGTGLSDAEQLAREIEQEKIVASVQLVDPDKALQEFNRQSRLGNALDLLSENPLPYTLVVTPSVDTVEKDQLQIFMETVRQYKLVNYARMDLRWLQRLHALTVLAIRAVLLIGALLCIAVALIVSNTIRLDIFNRQDEIDIISRVGGTGGFIRRPFLYSGCLQGILGALVAVALIEFGLQIVAGPIHRLVGLYHSDFQLHGPSFWMSLGILLTGGGLGWLASRITLHIHLRRLLPAP